MLRVTNQPRPTMQSQHSEEVMRALMRPAPYGGCGVWPDRVGPWIAAIFVPLVIGAVCLWLF